MALLLVPKPGRARSTFALPLPLYLSLALLLLGPQLAALCVALFGRLLGGPQIGIIDYFTALLCCACSRGGYVCIPPTHLPLYFFLQKRKFTEYNNIASVVTAVADTTGVFREQRIATCMSRYYEVPFHFLSFFSCVTRTNE